MNNLSFRLLAQQAAQDSQDLALSLLAQRNEQVDLDVQTAGQIGDLNKQLAMINAKFARESAQKDAAQIRRETERSVATIQASYAASGVVSTEGSAFLAQVEQIMEGAREEQKILEKAEIDALNSEIEQQKINMEQAYREMKAVNIKQQDLFSTQADIAATQGRLNLF